jgi:DNA-binding response OmpR family regulator
VAAFQAGADAFLATPFGPAELFGRVAELARRG